MQIKSQPSYDVNNYNVKSGTASNKSQEKAAMFANMLDTYSSEEVTTKVTYENMTEAERIKTLKISATAKTQDEAAANLELLKQKKAKNEMITEEDVTKCITSDQMLSFAMFLNPIVQDADGKGFRIAPSGRKNLADSNTMEFLFNRSETVYKGCSGQPENIIEFSKGLMNISGELYKILKENKAAQLANVSQ